MNSMLKIISDGKTGADPVALKRAQSNMPPAIGQLCLLASATIRSSFGCIQKIIAEPYPTLTHFGYHGNQ